MTSLPNKDLLRPDEVAEYFSIHRSTVYRWVEEGALDAKRVCGTIRIKRESVLSIQREIDEV